MQRDCVKFGGRLASLVLSLCTAACSTSGVVAFAKSGEELRARECPTVSKRAGVNGHNRLVAKVLIHASPEVVWATVHEERKKDPDLAYAKVLSKENNEMMLEEKFVLLPVIGTAKCIMKDIEVPNERIDYKLVESDRFKAMEGSWVLTPSDSGRSCVLELSSYLELGLPVPRMVLDGITSQKLQRRVANVKTQAEKAEAGKIAGTKPPES